MLHHEHQVMGRCCKPLSMFFNKPVNLSPSATFATSQRQRNTYHERMHTSQMSLHDAGVRDLIIRLDHLSIKIWDCFGCFVLEHETWNIGAWMFCKWEERVTYAYWDTQTNDKFQDKTTTNLQSSILVCRCQVSSRKNRYMSVSSGTRVVSLNTQTKDQPHINQAMFCS